MILTRATSKVLLISLFKAMKKNNNIGKFSDGCANKEVSWNGKLFCQFSRFLVVLEEILLMLYHLDFGSI